LIAGLKEGSRPFRIGLPAFDEFPYDVWNRLSKRYIESRAAEEIGYGPPEGHPLLRKAIAEHVTATRGAKCTAAQIVITNGAQHALDIIARMLIDRGDIVWVEDPGYPGSRAAFESVGANVVPVAVDAEGIDLGSAAHLARPRLIYTTPSHQFPLGVSMSASRRTAVLQLADAADAWIIEDDYDSEFRYESRPLTCLQGLDEHNRVIYVGTFSKLLFPGLRLGYLIVPPELVEAASVIRSITDRHSSMQDQAVLASFISEGHLGRHMRLMRTLYRKRRDTAVHALQQRVKGIEVANTDAGLHFVGWLPPQVDDADVADACFAAGVEVTPLSDFVHGGALRPALLFGFAAFGEAEMEEAVDRIAEVIFCRLRDVTDDTYQRHTECLD
jgi:GntR family transcriptional regulator/MocR family aminotransferase